MNPVSTNFVLGYHGCDASVAERVLAGKASLIPSENDYDWLGHGIYFWEHNAQRALEFALELRKQPRHRGQKIRRPGVVGAIIDLGFCLNMLDSRFIGILQENYSEMTAFYAVAGEAIPQNLGGNDLLQRHLDCAVIEFMHTMRIERHEPPFDTLRAAFIEGNPIYSGASFRTKNHIQICVRNLACIKGYFRPLDDDGKPLKFA